MPCLKKLWLVVLVVLSASQFTKAQLASAQILSFADSIHKDSLSSRIHTFQHNDIIYYEAYDPDNGLVKVYGYSTTTTENKELFQIAHRALSPYFFELGDRVFYVHDSSVNRSLIFAKFHGLDPKREFGPDFLLRRSGPIHVGTEKRAYFYGESSKGKGAYFFNGKSGNFKLVKESDAVKTLNIIGTYLREVVIQDRSGTYMGPTKDSLNKISEVALGALIGDENGTFFVEKKELAQKIYYREKGKTTLREFAQLPVEEPFYGFQK